MQAVTEVYLGLCQTYDGGCTKLRASFMISSDRYRILPVTQWHFFAFPKKSCNKSFHLQLLKLWILQIKPMITKP